MGLKLGAYLPSLTFRGVRAHGRVGQGQLASEDSRFDAKSLGDLVDRSLSPLGRSSRLALKPRDRAFRDI